jgi:AbrB family looped-hinge helix DNA binding protein
MMRSLTHQNQFVRSWAKGKVINYTTNCHLTKKLSLLCYNGKMERFSKAMEIGDNGRVVLPKEVRTKLAVGKGDKVLFIIEDDEIKVTTRAALVKKLRGIFARDDGRNLSEELLEDRRKEAKRKGW